MVKKDLKNNTKSAFRQASDGFALPTVLIASIVMLTVLLVTVTSTAAVRSSLTAQYYNQLSKTATESGLAYAKACLNANQGKPQWTNAKPLTPSTDCAGEAILLSDPVASVLVVAGGGGGGGNCNSCGGAGGGGAGGFIYSPSISVTTGAKPVVVGAGGSGGAGNNGPTGSGSNGSNSSFNGLVAIGGGAGQPQSGLAGTVGGSGGGGSGGSGPPPGAGGAGTSGQGFAGGAGVTSPYGGGGGGGAGGAGAGGGGTKAGGVGLAHSITGAAVYYAGGGGGGAYTTYAPGAGGLGGGGGGANQSTNGGNGIAGTASTGGGGGGANGSPTGGSGGSGGSGVVIISYEAGSLTATGGTISTVGGKTIHKFTSSGTFNVTQLNTISCPDNPTCSVLSEENVRSTFSVPKPEVNSDGVATSIQASGKAEVLRSSNSQVWRTYSSTSNESLIGTSDGTYVHSPKVGQTNFSSTYGYTGFQPGNCPSGFIPVPGSTLYNKPYGFCVMKYEAKNSGGIPVSTPGGAPWVNIPQSASYASQGKSSPSPILTDLSTATSPYYDVAPGLKSVTVDLGSIMQVDTVKIWHYWGDYRTYYQTKTEVSTDNTNWYTIFDSATEGTYVETPEGKTHQFSERPVRYIRDWLNGSTANTGNHWVEVLATTPTNSAIDKATSACNGCHLMTENEWLALAHNVVNQNSNWSGGTVGSGYIYSGHNDGSPGGPLIASLINDSDGYSGTGQTSGNQRRTLTLSNGEVIWDMAGNVAEFTDFSFLGGQPGDGGYAQRQWNSLSSRGSLPASAVPSYATPAANNWNYLNGIGSVYSNSSMLELRAVWRGGWWGSGAHAGVFYLAADTAPQLTGTNMGFRVAQ